MAKPNPPLQAARNVPHLEPDVGALLLSLVEAAQAGALSEVPVGAVVRDRHGRFLAQAGNRPVTDGDPAGHAEMRAIRQAAARVGNYRLVDAHLTTTLEPCPMCLETSRLTRFANIAFGITRTRDGWPSPPHLGKVANTACAGEIVRMLKFFFEPKRFI
ncbi:MAG: nucleoside deaminase [Magnetococcales bacterium]|nr:nucleoside deaminase [Magnetococcales bacterium]